MKDETEVQILIKNTISHLQYIIHTILDEKCVQLVEIVVPKSLISFKSFVTATIIILTKELLLK